LQTVKRLHNEKVVIESILKDSADIGDDLRQSGRDIDEYLEKLKDQHVIQ
jgi:hypothetical protein